jgi:hypothetical protein
MQGVVGELTINRIYAALQLKVAPEYRQMAPVYQWWLEQRAKAGWGPAA